MYVNSSSESEIMLPGPPPTAVAAVSRTKKTIRRNADTFKTAKIARSPLFEKLEFVMTGTKRARSPAPRRFVNLKSQSASRIEACFCLYLHSERHAHHAMLDRENFTALPAH